MVNFKYFNRCEYSFKPCRLAYVEMVQKRFLSFGISLLSTDLVLLASIINTFVMLVKFRYDEDEIEDK